MSGCTILLAPLAYVELDPTYLSIDLDLTAASASIRFQTDGDIQNHNSISLGEWHIPTGGSPGDAYEIRATANPDTPDIGTMNSWEPLSSNQIWTENYAGGPGDETKVFDIEIRPAGGGSVIASTTVTLKAEIII